MSYEWVKDSDIDFLDSIDTIPWRKCIGESSKKKKEELILLAKKSKDKPSCKTTLGIVLGNYTRKSSHSYDEEFYKEIRNLRPNWFKSLSIKKKEELLQIAKSGKPRPRKITTLGSVLSNYTRKSNDCYDEDFDKEIRNLRPDWFENKCLKIKQELLQIAKSGKPRPNNKIGVGRYLSNYINKVTNSYDEEFDKEIRNLRPDWFENKSLKIKQELLQIAKSGKPRPRKITTLGNALSHYTTKSKSYNPDFDKEIRNLRPDWFENTSIKKKEELLQIAKSGKPRPNIKTTLGNALSKYISKSSGSYDEDFDKEIRNLRPNWFRIK